MVFPTPVGVFLHRHWQSCEHFRLPHARGGVSLHHAYCRPGCTSSPRPWGCFWICQGASRRREVFPTPVGVFPRPRTDWSSPPWSSPRPWGCFPSWKRRSRKPKVFPTPVGVFLSGIHAAAFDSGLPHARGGVSGFVVVIAFLALSSPRPWGCFSVVCPFIEWAFVFPTPVGVFLSK